MNDVRSNWDISLHTVPFTVDVPALCETVHVDEDGELYGELLALVRRAEAAAVPRLLLRAVELHRGPDGRIAGAGEAPLSSPLLDKALEGLTHAVVYLATCGRELETLDTGGDPLAGYWLDCIQLQALRAAQQGVTERACAQTGWKKVARLNPGSLPAWPISEQTKVFALLGGEQAVLETAGVRLMESFLMSPLKSGSGLLYPTERAFENCMLCRRPDCIGRRTPYDEEMAVLYGAHSCGEEPAAER